MAIEASLVTAMYRRWRGRRSILMTVKKIGDFGTNRLPGVRPGKSDASA